MTASEQGFVVVTTTHESEEQARALASAVVRERLAACAQVYPVRSVYWWDGEVQDAEEWRIDLKTRAELVDRLGAFVAGLHSYGTPELIAVPVTGGSPGYLAWVAEETVAVETVAVETAAEETAAAARAADRAEQLRE